MGEFVEQLKTIPVKKGGKMLELEEKYNVTPICPHCDTSLVKIYFHELRAFLGRRYIYFCSHCHKVLGVSHRKGFWMG